MSIPKLKEKPHFRKGRWAFEKKRNLRSDRDLCEKVKKRNKNPNRKGKIKVQTEKGNKSPKRIWKVNERIKKRHS